MKIQSVIMLKLILSLFGCAQTPKTSSTSQMLGPFTLETITEKGHRWHMDSGTQVEQTTVSYAIQYKGKPVEFSEGLEENTALPGIWRVFHLKDAPAPTLLVGSQSLYLVTEEAGEAKVSAAFKQYSDFASIQWLDSEAGQPGEFREIYSTDPGDQSVELSGGRYLAVSRAVVLDVKTLRIYPFNTNNEWIDGYYHGQAPAISFSPDSSQLVIGGSKKDETTEMGYLYALISYDFKKGKSYAVPFIHRNLQLDHLDQISPEWMQDYFEWVKQKDGDYKIQQRESEKPLYRKGRLNQDTYRNWKYTLDHVKTSMLPNLTAFIQQELQLSNEQIQINEGDYTSSAVIEYQGIKLVLEFFAGDNYKLLVLCQRGGLSDPATIKDLIERIGKGFNAKLSQGEYQDQFTE